MYKYYKVNKGYFFFEVECYKVTYFNIVRKTKEVIMQFMYHIFKNSRVYIIPRFMKKHILKEKSPFNLAKRKYNKSRETGYKNVLFINYFFYCEY